MTSRGAHARPADHKRTSTFAAVGLSVALFGALFQMHGASAAVGTSILRVNAGGPAVTDASGQAWTADSGFTGGSPAYVSNDITGTTNPTLFRTEHYGMSAFSAAVPNGTYVLKLGFSENAPWVASRIFSVTAEGQPVLTNFDIRSEAGGNFKAIVKESNVTVNDGRLDLGFSATANAAKVSTIELVTVPTSPSTTTSTAKPTTTSTAKPTTTTAAPATTSTTAPAAPITLTSTVEENASGSGLNQFDYAGTWANCSGCGAGAANKSYRYGYTNSSKVTLRFNGTQAKIFGVTERTGGIVSFAVDGGAPLTVDTYANAASTSKLLFTTPLLNSGNHSIVMINTGSKNSAALAAVFCLDQAQIFSGGSTPPATTAPTTTSTTQAPATTTTVKPTTTTAAPVTTTTAAPATTTTVAPTTTAAPTTTTTAPAPVNVTYAGTVEDGVVSNAASNLGWFSYNGTWVTCGGCGAKTTNNSYRYAYTAGASVNFTFNGSQAKIYGIFGNAGGIATVVTDNGTPSQLNLYSTAAEYSGLYYTTPVLANGPHTVTITLTNQKVAGSKGTTLIIDKAEVYTASNGSSGSTTTTAKPGTTTSSILGTTTTTDPSRPNRSSQGVAPTNLAWGTAIQWDDFSGTAVDNKDWYVYNWPAGSPSRTAADTRVQNGELQLVGQYNAATGLHTSGGLSWNLAQQKYGRWETRVKFDAGAGFSPTVLLWPDTENWPNDGEIDLFEGGPYPDRQKGLSVLHNGSGNASVAKAQNLDFTQWHVIGVEWMADHITFYIDGQAWWTTTDKKYIPTTSSMHLALQNDTGCGWTACPNAQTKAETIMHVDWVRAYKA